MEDLVGGGHFIDSKTVNFRARTYGCIMGAFVGDAGGSYLEFLETKITDELVDAALEFEGGGVLETVPGQITDDSELATWLMLGILDFEEGSLQKCIAKRYVDWFNSDPIDIGTTTSNALSILNNYFEYKEVGFTKSVKDIGVKNYKSKSNGCLMRITPLAVYVNKLDDKEIQEYTKMDLSLTHSNKIWLYATTAYNIAIAHLLNYYNDSRGAIKRVQKYLKSLHEDTKDSDEKLPADLKKSWERVMSAKSERNLIPAHKDIGHIMIAFEYAFFYLKNNIEYEEAIRRMLKQGGDTDTNAAIVGGLLGARYGINGIPKEWRNAVLNAAPDRPEWLVPQNAENFFGQIDRLIEKSKKDCPKKSYQQDLL